MAKKRKILIPINSLPVYDDDLKLDEFYTNFKATANSLGLLDFFNDIPSIYLFIRRQVDSGRIIYDRSMTDENIVGSTPIT